LTFTPACDRKTVLIAPDMPMKTAVIILGHGSRTGDADKTVRRIEDTVRSNGRFDMVGHAFLQYAPPHPEEVIDRCVAAGASRIVIVPFFLQPGAHVTRDVPALAIKTRTRYPDVEVIVTDLVGSHPLMATIINDLAAGNTK
jgi:sirohydrochlorin ferrochelatase